STQRRATLYGQMYGQRREGQCKSKDVHHWMDQKINHAVQLDELGVVARRARQGASSLLSIGLARHCHGGGYRRVADRVGAIGGSVADAPELIRAFTDASFFCQLVTIGYRQPHTGVGDISVGPFVKDDQCSGVIVTDKGSTSMQCISECF